LLALSAYFACEIWTSIVSPPNIQFVSSKYHVIFKEFATDITFLLKKGGDKEIFDFGGLARQFLKEAAIYGDNLLADLKV
jgi:hypothetical protein